MISWRRPALVWGLAVLTTGAALAAALVARQHQLPQADARLADVCTVGATAIVAALILTARPGHRVGQVMLAGAAMWGLASPVVEWGVATLNDEPSRPWLATAMVALTVRGAGWILLVSALALMFPEGHLPSPRWRWLIVAALAAFCFGALFQEHPIDLRIEHLTNPVAIEPVASVSFLLGFALTIVCAASGFVVVCRRWRRADPLLREQIGWFVLACVLVPVVMVLGLLDVTQALPYPVAVAALPIAIGLAVTQRRLYNIQLVVNRTLLYTLLSAAVAAVYVLAVAGLAAMIGVRSGLWLGLIGAGAVVAVAEPIRRSLQRAVNHLVYGGWEDPHELTRRLGGRLADAAAPDSALDMVLAELCAALRLRSATIVHGETQPHDHDAAHTYTTLIHEGQTIGALHTVAERKLRPRDIAVLCQVAQQLAPVVRAGQLAAQLRTSRDRLAMAQEDERGRLRRDLHDGLGPTLAALTFKVDTARNVLAADPDAQTLLLDIRDGLRDTVTDVRRLVDGLRPPLLDQVGLGGALARLIEDLPGPTRFRFVLADQDGTVGTTMGVAAYRIAQEALTNVVRHAGATTCDVELTTADGSLRLVVRDDGGGQAAAGKGNGMATMRERAEDAGGTLTVSSEPGRGTVVTATLPKGYS